MAAPSRPGDLQVVLPTIMLTAGACGAAYALFITADRWWPLLLKWRRLALQGRTARSD